jgi:(S)-3,5-dihydroxyphenylglycine transaminase
MLAQAGGSLEPIVAPKRTQYRRQRDAMNAALSEQFADLRDDVRWDCPAGGFFVPVTLPFAFGPAELRRCARDHDVLVTPMRFFCVGASRDAQIRLSFSAERSDAFTKASRDSRPSFARSFAASDARHTT